MSIVIILAIILLGGAVHSFWRFSQTGNVVFQNICVFFGVVGFALVISAFIEIFSAKERKGKHLDGPENKDLFSVENMRTFFLKARELISPFGRFF